MVSGSIPESGDSGGSNGGTSGRKGHCIRRKNRYRKRHDSSGKVKSF